MARKPSGKPSSRAKAAPRQRKTTGGEPAVDALMRLLKTRSFAEIGLGDIAGEAGLSLTALREAYDGKFAILTAFSRQIDKAVLDAGPAEGETPRDRLFEIVMRRLDALEPHNDALRNVARAARRDACLAAALHCNAVRSTKWMTVAADADKRGAVGVAMIEGLVLLQSEVVRVWLDDDDPGLAKTMAALDRGLARGARAMDFVDDVCGRLCNLFTRDRATRDGAAASA
jgi:AcrR family transcriptional regulator